MGSLTCILNITADRYVADVNGGLEWHAPFWDEELSTCLIKELGHADKLLLGRNTYEGLKIQNYATLNSLSAAKSDLLLAETFKHMQKIVISSDHLCNLWSNTEQVRNERQVRDLLVKKDLRIAIIGSVLLVNQLFDQQMISDIVYWHHPVKLTAGITIAGKFLNGFELLDVHALQSGVTRLKYTRKK